ncbi:hypothetical protein ACTFIZ_007881 [Dictyostelium cf. discoideum]
MDYNSNYSESTLEYVEIQECILEKQKLLLQQQQQQQQLQQQQQQQTNIIKQQIIQPQEQKEKIKNNNNSNNNNDDEVLKSVEVLTISPYLTIGMKYGLIIEFLMVVISMMQYIMVGKWMVDGGDNDRVENYWPINKYYGLFIFTIVFNGMVSAWKGYKVDQRLFFAAHHLLTMFFFFVCFVYFPTVKYYVYLVIYLVMRLGKRIKDEGYMNKDQWITFYVSYAYVQTLVIVIIQCLQPNQSGILDIIGGIAHIDSLITCRKENFSGKRLNGNSKWLIPIWLLENSLAQTILSVLDVSTLWCTLLIGTSFLNIFSFNFYRCIIPFLLIEFLIKPLFSSFKRPYCYKFSNHSSFPSCHTAIASIVISSIGSISPFQRGFLVMLMAVYRVYTRAHTVEDICAGFAIGQVLNSIIISIGFYFFGSN